VKGATNPFSGLAAAMLARRGEKKTRIKSIVYKNEREDPSKEYESYPYWKRIDEVFGYF
jgi:hypothetical protein